MTKRLLSLGERGILVNVSPTSSTVALSAPGAGASSAERIVHAAAQAFAEKGFAATTTRDIASGAGLSPAGVYVHFSSKEQLLFALSKTGHDAAVQLLEAALASSADPREQLRRMISDFSAWHAVQFEVARVVQYEHHHLSAEHRAEMLRLRKEMDALVRRVLTAGVEQGVFDVESVPDTALALLSIVVDVARWYSPTMRRTPEQIGATNAALSLRLVSASAP